jgi:hypothetical protein
MKRIGLLTDHWGPSSVRGALESIGRMDGYRLETIDDFRSIESIAQAVWGLLNLVDVVVAYITKDSRNIYYEIGLAHGLGKPVIVLVEGATSLSGDLIGQRVISVDSNKYSSENLAFRIKEAIDETDRRGRAFTGYRGPREDTGHYPPSGFDVSSVADFRSLFSFEGAARGIHFERWLSDVARAVPGWEVIESERSRGRDQGFDLVIWNSRDDFELNALGNPIAIELKSIRAMNASMLSDFLNRARKSGLKAVVLATTGINDARTQKMLSRLRKEGGINAIALDRDDLIQVTHPEDLLMLFKRKVRELLYEGEF